MSLVLATSNPGKIAELQALLAPLAIEVLPQSRFTAVAAEETGLSFIENAILKARHAARASGLPAIADDSGIEVDALHGAPGIYSARYAGATASDRDNLNKLLLDLRDVPAARRTARYRCVLAFMRWDLDPAPIVCQASWEGVLIATPRGTGGFGYDPIFEVEPGVTVAELAAEEKNQRSHRGQALRMMVEQLRLEPKGVSLRPLAGQQPVDQ
ncbi:MAG TPA: RdgB/HAM1 family non-canonical purine NTP pyrophosphatase [Steroidobacteraceae bacterium]